MRILRTLLAAALLAAGNPAALAGKDAGLPGEILVKLRSSQALEPLLARYQLGVMGQFGSRPIYRLSVTGKVSVEDTLAALVLEADVLLAEANSVNASPEARKNAVWAIGKPQAYAVQWAPAALRLADAHRVTTGAGMRVAVLDTGVDRTHPALAGKLLPGFDFVDDDNDPSEEGSELDVAFGHGTHVAGLVALVAPDAKIMPVRMLDPAGQGNTWVLAEALLYAIDPDGNPETDDGAHIVNLSLGTANRTRIFNAIAQIATCSVDTDPVSDISDPGYDADDARCSRTRGVLIVAAAGNDGSDSAKEYPAAESSQRIAAVGASAEKSRLAPFSNFASWVRFTAPGDRITSSVPGGGYGTWSGTSMASPLFAGTAALVRSVNPDMKPEEVLRRIGSRSAALCGSNLEQIDAYAAVRDAKPRRADCP
ncbi:MAG: S8 family serine peptidase [Betaproteobacteria bacterium]|nr:S8 family serine peptidase [Betaproteobacteria bacterium]